MPSQSQSPLTRAEISENYRNPFHFGQPEQSEYVSAQTSNRTCGDEITAYFVPKTGKYYFTGSACALSIATASMLARELPEFKHTEIAKLDLEFLEKELLGTELSPNRQKCALLPLEAFQEISAKLALRKIN